MKKLLPMVLLIVASLLPLYSAEADVVVDYSEDGGFFTTNTVAKAALEQAVSDINSVLDLSSLGAITNDTLTGTSGASAPFTTLNFDFDYSYTNPSTGANETIADTTLGAGVIRIFAGARILNNTTLGPNGNNVLGQGGPGGSGLSGGGTTGMGTFADAVANAAANHQHARGTGPTMFSLSGDIGGAAFSFDMGPTVGNLWFDSDTDNDNVADTTSVLNANWHFDHTTPVAAGKSDFYSVALHETLHALGLGGSATWGDLVSGTDWLGADANSIAGSGIGLIDSGGAHIASNTLSLTLDGGVLQEAVMTPSLLIGSRKYLTELDVAFLRDINYLTVTAIPEPSSFLAILVLSAGTLVTRRSRSMR